jgi:hypothetical protein
MKFDELEAIVGRLMSPPLRGQIQIGFDRRREKFILSVPIFRGEAAAVRGYVEARSGYVFRPFETVFRADGKGVRLVQEVPFQWGFQPTMRELVMQFWQMAKRCHQMLHGIAVEERFSRKKF